MAQRQSQLMRFINVPPIARVDGEGGSSNRRQGCVVARSARIVSRRSRSCDVARCSASRSRTGFAFRQSRQRPANSERGGSDHRTESHASAPVRACGRSRFLAKSSIVHVDSVGRRLARNRDGAVQLASTLLDALQESFDVIRVTGEARCHVDLLVAAC